MNNNTCAKGVKVTKTDRRGRSFYVNIFPNEVICSVPFSDNKYSDLNAVLTALTRMMSIAMQEGVSKERVMKQLRCSVINKNDLPSLILQAMEEADGHSIGKNDVCG